MRKQLKDLTEMEVATYCCNHFNANKRCDSCKFCFGEPPIYDCRIGLDYRRKHPEEWIEWDEEEKSEPKSEIPKGFIEVTTRGDLTTEGSIMLVSVKQIVWVENEKSLISIRTSEGNDFVVDESYEEIKAKIAEALK